MERRRLEPTISQLHTGINWNARRRPVDRQPDCPLLLGAVALLLAASGIGLGFLVLGSWSDLTGVAREIGMGTEWPYALAVLAGAALFSGLLLFSGSPLGWYLAVLILVSSLLAAIQGILAAYGHGFPLALAHDDTISWYTKLGMRALLSLLLVVYFCTVDVRRFCSVPLWSGLICAVSCALLGVVVIII